MWACLEAGRGGEGRGCQLRYDAVACCFGAPSVSSVLYLHVSFLSALASEFPTSKQMMNALLVMVVFEQQGNNKFLVIWHRSVCCANLLIVNDADC